MPNCTSGNDKKSRVQSTKLPDRQITCCFRRCASPVPFEKIFRFRRRANHRYRLAHPVPLRGALAIVTNVGAGCGGRGSVRRAAGLRGGLWPVSDQRHADDRCCCVRQNRVVLAPVAGVKLAEMLRTQPGLAGSLIRLRRRQDEFVSGESTA
jgi:hypothetical protein